VWSPDYGDGNEKSGGAGDNEADHTVKAEEISSSQSTVKKEPSSPEKKPANGQGAENNKHDEDENEDKNEDKNEDEDENDEGDHFEMELGAEIRFKIKSIHFTQVTNTAKGIQATTTTTAYSQEIPTKEDHESGKLSPDSKPRPLRKRSLSMDITDMSNLPASMNIVASICEDGLGLTSWWTSGDDDEEEDVEEGGDEEGET
jgi:hypothetical protein